MKEVRDFTDKELAAIKELEKAFAVCARLGLSFVGMDDDLMCMHKDAIDTSFEGPFQWQFRTQDQGCRVVRAKTYLDSGGF